MDKELLADYESDRTASRNITDSFDQKESMLLTKVEDSLSDASQFKSRVTDGRLSTIIWERSGRVMGQLPKGVIKAMTKADKGKAMLMDIVLQRYIVPNADSQHSHLLKLRMWDLYSMVYGVMPMMYDYRIDDEYIGPDCWLVPIRNWIPQRGKMSLKDSDYTHVDSYVSVRWLKGKLDSKIWDKAALRKIIKQAEDGGIVRKKHEEESYVERDRNQNSDAGKGKAAQVKLTTRYEVGKDGHWITFAPDYDGLIIRDIPNPHKSGRIPIVLKYCFPLIDSVYGLGDFERGKTLQFAMDSLINLYLDGVKMSVFPPTILNPNGVVPSSIRYSPGARWLENMPNSIRTHTIAPQGLQTFQSTYSFLIGSLLNQNGTTDTAANAESSSDPGFGKTPEALKLLAARENTRDNWDRFMMEEAVEELYDGMINLVAKKQAKSIDLHLFDEEIDQIIEMYPEVTDMMQISDSGEYAKLSISPDKIGKNIDYRFYVEAGSTMRKDDASQSEALTNLLVVVSKIPGLQQQLQSEGVAYSVGEHMKRIFSTSGVDDYDKILHPASQEEMMNNGNLNQPPQGSVPPTMAETTMQAPAGVDPNTVPAQANPQTGQMAYVPSSLSINPNSGSDPDVEAAVNEILK